MATITANTSSFIGDSLNVLDPNTWVGGVVPGIGDTAVFPHRAYSYYRSTGATNPTSQYYYHPIQGPWSGSSEVGAAMPKVSMIDNQDGVTRHEKELSINWLSLTNLGLDETHKSNSGSVLVGLYPWLGQYNQVKLNYGSKGSTAMYTCSIDHSFKEWKNPDSGSYWTSSVNYDNEPAYGRFYYNQNYVIRNLNEYHLTGSATWSVDHIDMGNWTKFTIKENAKLELCGSTPYIDLTYGNFQRLDILDQAHLQISCSSGVNSGNTGIYSLNKAYQMITISGSTNFSGSMVTTIANEDDTTLTVADADTFVEGDLISVSNTFNPKYKFNYPMNSWFTDYLTGNSLNYGNRYVIGVTESLWGGPQPIQVRNDNPYNEFQMGVLSGSVMKNEWMFVATSSRANLTVEKLLTDRGWIEEELGQYSYTNFISTFNQTLEPYKGNKTVVLLNSYHRNYKSGDKVIINKKAYTLDFVGTHLKQDILHDFTAGDGTTVDPHDVFVWSPNELSGSFYNDTLLQGSYYSWPEYYRKGTLWDSGSHVAIDGTVVASGSFFLNPNKLRSWGAYGNPYNSYRYDTYLQCNHHLSGSFWLEGEIEISASVSDDPFHNTYQEKRFDESGSRYNPYSGIAISWPVDPSYRSSGNGTDTSGLNVTQNTRGDRDSNRFGFDGLNYGVYQKTQHLNDYGKFMPFIRGLGNTNISGSIIESYGKIKPYHLYVSMSDMNTAFNNLPFPPANITGSGNSFSMKWVREGTNNQYFYKDGKSGQEIKCFEDHIAVDANPSIKIGLYRNTRLYKISVKGRYQLAVLNSTDTGFTRLDNITRAGLIADKDTSFKAEFLGTQIADPMGYENLLRDWRKKRGKTGQYPYIQGFTYNANNYNSGIGYLNDYYGIGTLLNPSHLGKSSNYWSYPWSNASCHYTFDFGAPITFDTIGLRVNYDGYGEGTRSTTQQGTGNYMTNIGIEYTLDGTTNFEDSNTGSFRATAPDMRQSTGRGNPIRFYTGSQEITARVIRIKNAGGSRGTSTTRLGFLGVYSGISGSTARQIKLKSTKHFQVGDKVIFWSNQLGPDGNCTNNGNNQVSYYNTYQPSYITNYNQGNYYTDVEPRTVGGFREEYDLVAIDYTTNIVTLDRDPVHHHLEKDTIVFKINRGNIKLDVAHLGRDRNGFNIRTGYGNYRWQVLHNFHQQGYTSLGGTTGYINVLNSVKNTSHAGRIQSLSGLYMIYESYKNCHVENIIMPSSWNSSAYGRGSNSGKNSIYGMYAGAQGNNAGYISWNGRRSDIERNFMFLVGGYAGNNIYYPHFYGTNNPNPIFRNVKIHNTYNEAYYNYFNNLSVYHSNRLNRMIRDKDYKNNYSHTNFRSNSTNHGFQTFDNSWAAKQEILDKRAQGNGLWLYNGKFPQHSNGLQYGSYDDYGEQHIARSKLANINFSRKDTVIAGNSAWKNGPNVFRIFKEAENHYKISKNSGATDSDGYTSEGQFNFKYCEFRAEADTQIKLNVSLEYVYAIMHLMSIDEHTEMNAGYWIKDKKWGYGRAIHQKLAKVIVVEVPPEGGVANTIFQSSLINNSLNFALYSISETITLRKDSIYRIQFSFGFGRQYNYNQVIFEYKNPKFFLTIENKNNITMLQNTWNLERLFAKPEENTRLQSQGSEDPVANPIIQVNNLATPNSVTRLNKIKL